MVEGEDADEINEEINTQPPIVLGGRSKNDRCKNHHYPRANDDNSSLWINTQGTGIPPRGKLNRIEPLKSKDVHRVQNCTTG